MKTPKEQPISLAEAQGRLDEIARHRARLIANRLEMQQRLESLEEQLGRRYLEGDRSGIEQKQAITAELQILESALAILAEDERPAQRELQWAQVRELRARAQEKRTELNRLNENTRVLLAKLSELEGVEFTHSILSSQPLPEMWIGRETLKPNPESWLAFWELMPNVPGQTNLASPKSRLLRKEIEELELQADTLQQKLQRAEAA